MASIIKNQILKYLSRYFKNLSNDKINFNTIRGEGELAYLELDEVALTDLLELPSWMRIQNASCNRVKFQIPWTRLKSEPMVWNLDEVMVEIETCDELRLLEESTSSFLPAPGKYNTVTRIVDGMTINVNTAYIKFSSTTFIASLQILRINVESRSSAWEKCDLRHTRIKDTKRGQILLFKELSWQSLRIEAKSIAEDDLPPLRLLTNDALCRITIKKKLSDCFIIGSKLVLILDDLLWVLTDSQLKAALHFLDSLTGLIKKANTIVLKKKAARKLEVLPEYQAQVSQTESVQNKSAVTHIFSCHDVIETSYHILARKIDLHFSDDPGPGRSHHPELVNGGSIRVKLFGFQVDYYPYHLAVKDRNHWGLYRAARYPHPKWLACSQEEFRNQLLGLVKDDFTTMGSCSSSNSKATILQNGLPQPHQSKSANNIRKYLISQFNKIMTSCIVLRIGNFVMEGVTTSKKATPKDFIKADKERFSLPESEIIHAEFTYYYYPGDISFPLPSPKFYVQIYPVQLQFDVLTIIWLNTFILNLYKSLITAATVQNNDVNHMFYFDVKIETTMPRLIFDAGHDKSGTKDRPRSLHLQASRILVSNTRAHEDGFARARLANVVNSCQMRSLFLGDDFPSTAADRRVVTDKFISHMQGKDNIKNLPSKLLNADDSECDLSSILTQDLLWIDAKDVWCINLESIWGDFYGVRAVGGNKPVQFLDAFPLSLWIHSNTTCETPSVHILTAVSNFISIQINQYQAAFLINISKKFSEVATFLTLDTDKIMKDDSNVTVVFSSIIPQIEITLVTAPQNSSKESSGVDVDSSVVPDTSSLDVQSTPWTNTFQNSLDSTNDEMRKKGEYAKGTIVPENVKTSKIPDNIRGGEPNTLSQIKKGFSNLMSIDFASKSFDDSSDTLSIRSDDSSDTERYLTRTGSEQLYRDDADAMFHVLHVQNGATVEVACEATVDGGAFSIPDSPTTTTSEKDSVVSFCKRKDLVAATTIKLGRLELIMQSTGLEGMIKLQIGNISIKECFSIPWDELQNKFSSRTRDWSDEEEEKLYVVSKPTIKLRYENVMRPPTDISSCNLDLDGWSKSTVRATVDDLMLELRPQTISCLAEFAEDLGGETVGGGVALPFEVLVNSVELLFADRAKAGANGSPMLSPVVIRGLRVYRDGDAIRVESTATRQESLTTVSDEETYAMRSEVELLRRRLANLEYLREENETLRQYQEETKMLRACLLAAQDERSALLEEKRSLLEFVGRLRPSVSDNATCKR